MTTSTSGRTRWRRAAWPAAFAAAFAAVLSLPWPEPAPPRPAGGTPFAWHQDERWQSLEAAFLSARAAGCGRLAPRIAAAFTGGERLLAAASDRPLGPDAPLLGEIERTVFDLGPMVAACPDGLPEYVGLVARLRSVLKRQSQHWEIGSPATRGRLYRLLYGSRAAVEEAMLQAAPAAVPALVRGDDEPSATPAAEILGVRVHSGDILVSRGGAPTSALIARGNDFPGNFSHVALVYVDARSGQPWVIEAHIERGVAVSSLADYLRDVKLRVMVLRPRADLPRLAADPMLPHEAAAAALAAARRGHIAYDFAMDFRDHSRLFCSEVASAAYESVGITLWTGLSHISSPGLATWLAGFGVANFETEEPSDLEYDPQLRVVAEWRDPDTLFSDHVDNAVVDAMLEGAEAGDPLTYPIALLPVARLAKAYSWLLNRAGAVGPVPEGLSAAAALRNREFTRTHAAIKTEVVRLAQEFTRRNGYRPPYWELVALARRARAEVMGGTRTPAPEGGTG